MSTIKKLTLKLKSGLLSELQSDTVLGHFCWRLKDMFGADKLKEFIELYQTNKPVFVITNSLLEKNDEIFFPKPLIHIKPSKENLSSKKEKILSFIQNKKLKSIKFLTLDQFNLFLNGKIDELYKKILEKEIEFPKFETQLRTSVEIDRTSLSSKEGQLFSYHPMFLDENTNVVFLIKVLDEDNFLKYECEVILKDIFEIGYGKKKSSGYGQFEVQEINGKVLDDFNGFEEPKEAQGFITLSNYLPSFEDDIVESSYDFIVKYGRLGEEKSLSDSPFKKPLIMFTPGSVFFTSQNKVFYGTITKSGDVSEYDLDAVQFGVPFTLKFNIS